jgi:2Fe-2S ferredoxin
MPKIIYVEHNGAEHVIDAEEGQSVMQAAVDHFVPGIIAECGGACSCATCHGYVDPAWSARVPAKSAGEEAILDGVMRTRDNSRLTCQIRMTRELDGLVVHLPASQF